MRHSLTGVIHGRTIELDQTEVTLEGLRVRVILEPLAPQEPILSKTENAQLLKEWAANGPQGPIDDETDFPS